MNPINDSESAVAHDRERFVTSRGWWTRMGSHPAFVCVCLAFVTFVVFWQVKDFEFVSVDDSQYVTSNSHIEQGLTWDGIVWAFTSRYAENWHPLTWLSHMADVTLFGKEASGPHIVNLFLHIANSLLLFLVLRELTGAHWRSALVGGLFAIHPLHVESVAWIAERKDVLSTLFWMLTLWAYARYAGERKVKNPKSKIYFALALLFFALGLMSKPMLVTLPFVLLLLDHWPLRRFDLSHFKTDWFDFRNLVREKIPFFALGVFSCIVTLWAQQKALSPLAVTSFSLRIENFFVSYARYLGKMFWPTELAISYPYPDHWPPGFVMWAVMVVVGLGIAAIYFCRRFPFVFTGWFWFLGTLIPVIGLVQVGSQSMADRYTYVPLIGMFIVLTWSVGEVFVRWRLPSVTMGVMALTMLAGCAMLTLEQLPHWKNSEKLFRHALAVTRDNPMAYHGLADYLADKGITEEAFENYQKALLISPGNVEILNNLGNLHFHQKQYTEAISCFEEALRAKPDYPITHLNFGNVLIEVGKIDEAMNHFTETLRLQPDHALVHYSLANTLVQIGRTDEAIEHYRLAVRYKPKFAEAENNFGVLLLKLKRLDEAIEHFRAVIQNKPNHTSAHGNLGNALASQGNWPESAAQYAEAVRLTPDSPEAHFGLAIALARLGRRDEAIQQLNETIQLSPDMPGAKQFLRTLEARPQP